MVIFVEEHREIWNVMRALLNADAQQGKIIYSTQTLDDKFRHFDIDMLLDLIENNGLFDCSILLNEFDVSARHTVSKANKLMSCFALQTRRRNIDLYIVARSMDFLGKRIRRNVDVQMKVDGLVAAGIECSLFHSRTGARSKIQISHEALERGLITEEDVDSHFTMDMEAMLLDYTLEVACLG